MLRPSRAPQQVILGSWGQHDHKGQRDLTAGKQSCQTPPRDIKPPLAPTPHVLTSHLAQKGSRLTSPVHFPVSTQQSAGEWVGVLQPGAQGPPCTPLRAHASLTGGSTVLVLGPPLGPLCWAGYVRVFARMLGTHTRIGFLALFQEPVENSGSDFELGNLKPKFFHLLCRVTPGRLLDLSEPRFPHL